MTKKIVSLIVSVLLVWFVNWLFLPTWSIAHIDGFFFFVFISLLFGANILIIASNWKSNRIVYQPLVVIGVIAVIVLIIGCVASSTIVNANKMHNQLGTVNEISFDDMIHEIDNAQIPIVDEELAQKHADKKIGEDVALGSRVDLGRVNIQEVNGEIIYVALLEHSGFWKWNKNHSTPGYITVSATNANKVQYVTEIDDEKIQINYQEKAYFGYNLKRHIRNEGYRTVGLTEYTFEIDDSGKPFWVVTTYKNTTFWSNPEATGVVIVDAQNGKTEFYGLDNIPNWVDIVQPKDFIEKQLDNWGIYVHGFWNTLASKEEEIKKTDLTLTVYMDGNCYYFTGMTSVGGDDSCVGFAMVNTRDKKFKICYMSGATENAAMKSAEGLVSDYGWTSTEPLPLNVNGIPTYVMALKDEEGLAKSYAMVNIETYSISAKGETLAEVSKNYIKKVAKSGTNSVVSSEEAYSYNLEGKVARISSLVEDGSTYYYLIIDSGNGPDNAIFTASHSISDELPVTREGDGVIVKYIDDKNGTFDIIEFDNTMYGNLTISEDQEKRNELDEGSSALDGKYDSLVEVNPELTEEKWNSLTDEEKAKLIEELLGEDK